MSRNLNPNARSALLAVCAWLTLACTAHSDIVQAEYVFPTKRYAHGVLGDAIEHGGLRLTLKDGRDITHTLPLDAVFEDTSPRLVDMDADGTPEVIVVESHQALGAQLAIYDETGKIAQTPHIGRANRWLAPIGAADLDGDGFIEVAYVDRPHLAKTLRVWRYRDGTLAPVANLPGLTNHRIGERDIGGGIRDCGSGPEMITASADWKHVVSTRLSGNTLKATKIAKHNGRASLNAALRCK